MTRVTLCDGQMISVERELAAAYAGGAEISVRRMGHPQAVPQLEHFRWSMPIVTMGVDK